MTTSLLIRELDEDVKAALRVQAAQHGRSMEAEARAIITAGVRRDEPRFGLGTRLHQKAAEIGFPALVLPPRDELPRAADFGE